MLVTGASGYLALHIIQRLLKDGYRVRGTVRSLANKDKIAPIEALKEGITGASLELVEANLDDASGWSKACEDCDFVLHTASPFPAENPKHEDELIKPAVDGTLNVLRACGPSVRRVVLTSSKVAVNYGHNGPPNGKAFTEDDWSRTDVGNMMYSKSKTLAERAAWDYMKTLSEGQRFDLCVLNPLLVFGPLLVFDPTVILPEVGKVKEFDITRMTQVLGVQPRAMEESIKDTCYSLIDRGFVKKTSK